MLHRWVAEDYSGPGTVSKAELAADALYRLTDGKEGADIGLLPPKTVCGMRGYSMWWDNGNQTERCPGCFT